MTNLKEIKEDIEEFDTSQRYQDVYKWFMYCKELLARLEDAEETLKAIDLHGYKRPKGMGWETWIDLYFKRWGDSIPIKKHGDKEK